MTTMRAKLIDDLPFVAFPGAIMMHQLDPLRPGQTRCGRDVDPWTAEFSAHSGDMCETCAAGTQSDRSERN